jgi:hypothetical protein
LYVVTVTVSQEKLLSHIDVYVADQEAAQEGEPMPSRDGILHPPPFESMALILALSCLRFVLPTVVT